jgi:hypothetical protein
MKVLVATRRSQGSRELDFDDCVDGELVWVASPCSRGIAPDHARCSCSIAFVGVASFGMTTTAQVSDLEMMTLERYVEALEGALEGVPGLDAGIAEMAAALARIAEELPTGTVLERCTTWLQPRFDPESAALNPSILDLPERHD